MTNKMFNDIMDSIINNASEEEIEIIIEKINDYFINHHYDNNIKGELSDSFDSSSCPFCGKNHIVKFGKDKKGHQRFRCVDCGKTFSTITNSLFSYSKKQPYQWFKFIESLFHGDTIKQSAQIVGICEYTSFVWRHKILSIISVLMDKDPVLEGIIYLDEKLVDINHVGTKQNNQEIPKKRGISNQKRNIACAIDEKGNTVIQVSETGRIHADVLIKIFKEHIPPECTVVSDSLRSYHKLISELGVTWIKIPSREKKQDGYTLDKVNHLHSSIALFLGQYRGISDKYLKNYIGLYKLKSRVKEILKKKEIIKQYKIIMNSKCQLRYKDFESEFEFSKIKQA